jgi:lipid-A-disaccharide synthase
LGRFLPDKAATIFISTGELSGEMHAAHLVRALQRLRAARGLPPAIVEGNGSAGLRNAGGHILYDVATWSELGIVANLPKASFFSKVLRHTVRYVLSNQHDMVILVDNRTFNTMLAKALRNGGYTGRIVYYVAPVRWESCYDPAEAARSLRNPRFLDVKRYCDFALPIYPVSLQTYQALEIPHAFVGHPLCELAHPGLSDAAFSALTGIAYDAQNPPLIIGALPGSRIGEIAQIGPPLFRGMALIQDAFAEAPDLPPVHVVTTLAHPELEPHVLKAARQAHLKDLILLDGEHRYDLMARARLMVVKSGTALHECMLLDAPAIMCYRVPAYMAWVARHVLRFSMPYFGFPNLLAGKPVVPELIQEDCSHTRIAEVAGSLLFEEHERELMQAAYAEVRELVCRPEPLTQAAEKLQGLLKY